MQHLEVTAADQRADGIYADVHKATQADLPPLQTP